MLRLVFALIVLQVAICCNDNYLEELENELTRRIEEYQQYTSPTENSKYIPTSDQIEVLPAVDFVIIGAGTGGAVVAKRLSENPQFKVAVIEAGGFENNLTSLPGLSSYVYNSPFNWDYKSIPLKYAAFGYKDQTKSIPRGKGFGGTTIINGLRYVRGSREDYDELSLNGFKEWDYKTMLHYYKKSEASNLATGYEDFNYHGHDGPTNVEFANDKFIQTEAVIKGLKEIGYPLVDYNGKQELGVSPAQMTIKDGFRVSTGKAFINPIKQQSNVKLLDNALALKILFTPDGNKATDVIFSQNNRLYKIPVQKEVIVCGGAINSPQLLMLSGVGPKDDLKRLNITLVKDLPVGYNLKDHPVGATIYVNFDKKYAVSQKSMKEHLKDLFGNRNGLYTVATGTRALSFHKTKYARRNEGRDLICTYASPLNFDEPSPDTSGLKREFFDATYKNADLDSALTIFCVNTNPLSCGKVTLKSANPFEYPLIDLNTLENSRDALVLGEVSYIIRKLLNSSTFKKYNASVANMPLPACKNLPFLSSEYLVCASKYVGTAGYHLFNTCTMGRSPQDSVVDSRLKVHGIKNLRVVDASVVERITGYPMAIVMAYAERVSDLIKENA